MQCPKCEGEKEMDARCSRCNGSGEGMVDGSSCIDCRGRGTDPMECDECDGRGFIGCDGCGEDAPMLLEYKGDSLCLDCIVDVKKEDDDVPVST